MRRFLDGWHSPSLDRHMDIAVYGHYGFALLLIPTAAADYLEYERFHLIDAIKGPIEAGKVKVFSINSINNESWLNKDMHPPHKAIRHNQFNEYVEREVDPLHQVADESLIPRSLHVELLLAHYTPPTCISVARTSWTA